MNDKIGIFIPIWNDAKTLPDILETLRKLVHEKRSEIVVVDDASTDRSAEIAKRWTNHVIRHDTNQGVGTATKTGLWYLARLPGIKFVIKLDADGQHDPTLVPKVIYSLYGGSDVVICSRFHELSDQTRAPLDRLLLNRVFAGLIGEITGWKITDARSGFMGFRAEHIQAIAENLITQRYGIPMELLLRVWARKPDARVTELPHPARYVGNLSARLSGRYVSGGESLDEKATRVADAYRAVLTVMNDLRISSQSLLKELVSSRVVAEPELLSA